MIVRPASFFSAFLMMAFAISALALSQDYCDGCSDSRCEGQCQNGNCQLPRLEISGWRGQPWHYSALGGCECGSCGKLTNYNFSTSWPSPFSVLMDHGRCGDHRRCTSDTRNGRWRDSLDVLADVRLLPPIRCDNGYSGRSCDPYGLLGRSRRDFGDVTPDQPSLRAPERAPEMAPVEPLTMIPRFRQNPSDKMETRSLAKLPGIRRPAMAPALTRLSQPVPASGNEPAPTVLSGQFPTPTIERKTPGVVWESVADNGTDHGTSYR